MPGFSSNVNGDGIVYAKNADFSGSSEPSNTMLTNGQLWIASTALNAGSTHINVGLLTSPGATMAIGYSSPNITLDVLTAYTDPSIYPYTALSTDQFISVTTAAAARTINLPDLPIVGKVYTIKDRTGNASANAITVTTTGGAVLIDGAATYNLNSNYGSISLIFNGTSYEIY